MAPPTKRSSPIHWSQTENVAWKVPIPGKGHSSPVVWGDHIFVTTCLEKEQQRALLCLDRRDGKRLWQKIVLTSPLEKKHNLNSFASSTPATDGRFVWVSFLETLQELRADGKPKMRAVVVCYDFEGREVWRSLAGGVLLGPRVLQPADPVQGHGHPQRRPGRPGFHRGLDQE